MLTDLLNLHAEILRKRIVEEMAARGKNASGKTAAGLQIVVADNGFKLIDTTGNFYYVEYGSAPHKNQQGKANTTLASIIKKWLKAKGITVQGNENSVAYAIAMQLKRKGSKQYQNGKPAGIIKAAMSKDYTDKLIADLTQSLIRNY
jgi:hypothetical protein